MENSKVKYQLYKRLFDIFFAFLGLIIFTIPLIIIGILIKVTSGGPVIHWSNRIGKNNKCFRMAKLRTMKSNCPVLASDLLDGHEEYLICFGKYLREFGIDELPQLYNILKGDMSFVGPRPVILNDFEIIELRKEKGVNHIKPGLTGLAQINGRYGMPAIEKVKYDEIYMQNMCVLLDIKIILLTNYRLSLENFFLNSNKNFLSIYFTKSITTSSKFFHQ